MHIIHHLPVTRLTENNFSMKILNWKNVFLCRSLFNLWVNMLDELLGDFFSIFLSLQITRHRGWRWEMMYGRNRAQRWLSFTKNKCNGTERECYLFCMFGGASAAVPWVARFECADWGFVNAADHRLAAAQRGRTHLRVHWYTVVMKAMHWVKATSGQVVFHGRVHSTVNDNKRVLWMYQLYFLLFLKAYFLTKLETNLLLLFKTLNRKVSYSTSLNK